MDSIERQLKRPFAVSKLKWRKGGGGKELVYITARDVQDRLDEVLALVGGSPAMSTWVSAWCAR